VATRTITWNKKATHVFCEQPAKQ